MTTNRINQAYPPAGQFETVDGFKVHYLDTGTPNKSSARALKPIIMIHGASANALDMQSAFKDTLLNERRVIMVDRSGHGHSERAEDGHLLTAQSRQIHGLVQSLGIDKPIILGQSFGGVVALNYALEYPEALSGLLLIAPVSHEWPGGVAKYHNIALSPVAGPVFRNAIIPLYGSLNGEGAVASSFKPQAAPEGYYEEAGVELVFRPDTFKYNSEDLLNLKDQILTQQTRYSEIKVPTRIIAGTADRTVYPELHSMALEREIPGAEFTFMEGIGHPLHHFSQHEIGMLISQLDAEISGR